MTKLEVPKELTSFIKWIIIEAKSEAIDMQGGVQRTEYLLLLEDSICADWLKKFSIYNVQIF